MGKRAIVKTAQHLREERSLGTREVTKKEKRKEKGGREKGNSQGGQAGVLWHGGCNNLYF